MSDEDLARLIQDALSDDERTAANLLGPRRSLSGWIKPTQLMLCSMWFGRMLIAPAFCSHPPGGV